MSEYVAAGSVFNTLWMPSPSGMQFRNSVTSQMSISTNHGKVSVIQGEVTSKGPDAIAATALRSSISMGSSIAVAGQAALFSKTPSALGAVSQTMRARNASIRKIGDKTIRVAFVPDPEVKGRPKAVLIFVNNRISAVMESQYIRRGRHWIPTMTRTTGLDSTGKLMLITDSDTRGLVAQSDLSQVNRSGGLRGVLPAMVRLVQPDVLYAATTMEEDDGTWCLGEALAVASAGLWVASAVGGVALAEAGVAAADAAMVAALAACTTIVACAAALAAGLAAEALAATALTSAQLNLAAASTAEASAVAFLATCIENHRNPPKPPDQTTTGSNGGGGGGSEGGGCAEEWCQWTIHFDYSGNIESVTTDYCWCERQYEE
ncbi:MAG: hypothetical protein ABJE10_19325 [bacterium]